MTPKETPTIAPQVEPPTMFPQESLPPNHVPPLGFPGQVPPLESPTQSPDALAAPYGTGRAYTHSLGEMFEPGRAHSYHARWGHCLEQHYCSAGLRMENGPQLVAFAGRWYGQPLFSKPNTPSILRKECSRFVPGNLVPPDRVRLAYTK